MKKFGVVCMIWVLIVAPIGPALGGTPGFPSTILIDPKVVAALTPLAAQVAALVPLEAEITLLVSKIAEKRPAATMLFLETYLQAHGEDIGSLAIKILHEGQTTVPDEFAPDDMTADVEFQQESLVNSAVPITAATIDYDAVAHALDELAPLLLKLQQSEQSLGMTMDSVLPKIAALPDGAAQMNAGILPVVQTFIHMRTRQAIRSALKSRFADVRTQTTCQGGVLGSLALFEAVQASAELHYEERQIASQADLQRQLLCLDIADNLRIQVAFINALEEAEKWLAHYQLSQWYPYVAALNLPTLFTLNDLMQWIGETPVFNFIRLNKTLMTNAFLQTPTILVGDAYNNVGVAVPLCPGKGGWKTPPNPIPVKKPTTTRTVGKINRNVPQPATNRTVPIATPTVVSLPYTKDVVAGKAAVQLNDPLLAKQLQLAHTPYGVVWSGDDNDFCSLDNLFDVPAIEGLCLQPKDFLDRIVDPVAWGFGNCSNEEFIEQGLRCRHHNRWCPLPDLLSLTDQKNYGAPPLYVQEKAICAVTSLQSPKDPFVACVAKSESPMPIGPVSTDAGGQGGVGSSGADGAVWGGVHRPGTTACGNSPVDGDDVGGAGDGGDSSGDDSGDDAGGDDGDDEKKGKKDDDDGSTGGGESADDNDDGSSAGGESSDNTPSQTYNFDPMYIEGTPPKRPAQPPAPPANKRPGHGGSPDTGKEPNPPGESHAGSGSPSAGSNGDGSAGGGTMGNGEPFSGPKFFKGDKWPALRKILQAKLKKEGYDAKGKEAFDGTWAKNMICKYYNCDEEAFEKDRDEFIKRTLDVFKNKEFRKRLRETFTIYLEKLGRDPLDEDRFEQLLDNLIEKAEILTPKVFHTEYPEEYLGDSPEYLGTGELGKFGYFAYADTEAMALSWIGSAASQGTAFIVLQFPALILMLTDPAMHEALAIVIIHEMLHVLVELMVLEDLLPPEFQDIPAGQADDPAKNTLEHQMIYFFHQFIPMFLPKGVFQGLGGKHQSSFDSQTPGGAGAVPGQNVVAGDVILLAYGPVVPDDSDDGHTSRYDNAPGMCNDPMACRGMCTVGQEHGRITEACGLVPEALYGSDGDPAVEIPDNDEVIYPNPEASAETLEACADYYNSDGGCDVTMCPPDDPTCCDTAAGSGAPWAIDPSHFQQCWIQYCGEGQEQCPCEGTAFLQQFEQQVQWNKGTAGNAAMPPDAANPGNFNPEAQ